MAAPLALGSCKQPVTGRVGAALAHPDKVSHTDPATTGPVAPPAFRPLATYAAGPGDGDTRGRLVCGRFPAQEVVPCLQAPLGGAHDARRTVAFACARRSGGASLVRQPWVGAGRWRLRRSETAPMSAPCQADPSLVGLEPALRRDRARPWPVPGAPDRGGAVGFRGPEDRSLRAPDHPERAAPSRWSRSWPGPLLVGRGHVGEPTAVVPRLWRVVAAIL